MEEVAHALIAGYLAFTLSATALAKLKEMRTALIGVQRERVMPSWAAGPLVAVLIAVEFSVATLLMCGTAATATAYSTAVLFALFAAYRAAVAVKTKSLTCSCAGKIRTDPASFPSVTGAIAACLIMAALAFGMSRLGPPVGYPLAFIPELSWILPPIALAIGSRHGFKAPKMSNSHPVHLLPLWTAEIPPKR